MVLLNWQNGTLYHINTKSIKFYEEQVNTKSINSTN